MKKLVKHLLNTLSVIAITLTLALTCIACAGGNKNASTGVDNVNLTSETNNTTDNVSDETNGDNVSNTDEEIVLDGIYKYTKQVNFSDIYYESANELYTFFHTRDLNGVYDAATRLGFNEYYNYLIKEEGSEELVESMLYFNNGTINSVLHYQDGTYKIENQSHEINEYCMKIELDEENNVYVLYRQFCYQDETTGNVVETPLYVKVPVTLVANSSKITEGFDYVLNANTVVVNVDTNNMIESSDYLSILANMFGIEATDDETVVMNEITNILNGYTYKFSNNYAKLAMFDAENKFVFAPISEENIFEIRDLSLKFDGFEHNLSNDVKSIKLSINIAGETELSFTLIEK